MTRGSAAGGGSGAAAWAAHTACERYRGTDNLLIGRSRRKLADELGYPDISAGIPDARWTRAMIFERLCHDAAFAGEVAARATGWSGFLRPKRVMTADCQASVDTTAAELRRAMSRAAAGTATLLTRLAVPFPNLPFERVTNVLPDLAVVAQGPTGPCLIVGDVKDYERVRSRLDDGRLLKGFLQVAMGAFAFQDWSECPSALRVSEHGFLAVPRSVFLQPTVEVEDLTDHLAEVRAQVDTRVAAVEAGPIQAVPSASELMAHLVADFDPDTCPACSLFNYCREELRDAPDPGSLFVELGIPTIERRSVAPLLVGCEPLHGAKATTVHRVRATLTGAVSLTGQRRLDPVDRSGAVDVIAAKSDSAALGFHGIGVRRTTSSGPTDWLFEVFDDPQADRTRRDVMNLLGRQIEAAMSEARTASPSEPDPVHVVVPDAATADLLASTADLLAGVELSRLRWERDKQMGRPILTYNGEPAIMPRDLKGSRRTAVSFLLEHDRARMLKVRAPVVDLTSAMSRHFVPGGAAVLARRLDYLVQWAAAEERLDHRTVADDIEASPHTPGARLANRMSDAITRAREEAKEHGDLKTYEQLVREELEYKAAVFDGAVDALEMIPDSKLLVAVSILERDAQVVWRRRMALKASDLVRFGRTYPYWRNILVGAIQDDHRCATQIEVLSNPAQAAECADDAGNRDLTWGIVVSVDPITIEITSRRFGAGDRVVLLAKNGAAWLEREGVSVTSKKTAIQLRGFPMAELERGEELPQHHHVWRPSVDAGLRPGDRIVLARLDWFDPKRGWFNVNRPKLDDQAAPSPTCTERSYDEDSASHRWCCRPHAQVEAEFADDIAGRRARNELNPEAWPPVHDADGFEVAPAGKPTSRDVDVPVTPAPEGATTDELE